MYDKYNSLTPFAVGTTKLPKHKGLLINAASTGTVTTYVLNSNGTTGAAGFSMQVGPTVLPIEFYAVTGLGGTTGWLLN